MWLFEMEMLTTKRFFYYFVYAADGNLGVGSHRRGNVKYKLLPYVLIQ